MITTTETTLDVNRMSCGACVRHVSTALRGLDGVTNVDVRLKDGKVVVRHDPTRTSLVDLIAALDKAGYGSQLSAAAQRRDPAPAHGPRDSGRESQRPQLDRGPEPLELGA